MPAISRIISLKEIHRGVFYLMPNRHRVLYRAAPRRGLITIVFLAMVALFVGIENLVIQSFSACINEEATQNSDDNSKRKTEIVSVGIKSQMICSLRLIDRHNGFFALLAAAAVAWFTFTLRNATHLLWEAAKETLETTERAFVFIDGFTTEITTAADVPAPDLQHVPERYRDRLGLYLTRFAVQPRWKNSGNTPTRRMTIQISWGRFPPLPMPPEYDYRDPSASFFLAPKATEPSGVIEMPGAGALIDFGAFRAGDPSEILIWGRADYEDVFDKRHFVEWCYQLRFDQHDGKTLHAGFVQFGNHNRTDADGLT